MRFFTFECIIQDSVNHIKRIFGRKSHKSSTSVSDQIAFTAASLIHTIFPQHIMDILLIDLITLSYDLSILAAVPQIIPNAASSKDRKSSSIELLMFVETINSIYPDSASPPYLCHVPTYESLNSLQCGILRIVFILLTIRHAKVTLGNQGSSFTEDVDHFSVICHSGEERFTCYRKSWLLDLIQHHGDLRDTILITLKQIITFQTKAIPSSSDMFCDLLLLNTKLTACNLLTLILPDFSKTADEYSHTVSIWGDICELVSFMVLTHMLQVQNMYVEAVDGMITSATESLLSQISTQLSTLLRDTIIIPLYPYKPGHNDMLKIRDRSVRILWDSLTHLFDLASRPFHFNLCKMVLRAIHCSLYVDVSSTRFTDENDKRKLLSSLNDLKIQARAYFISHGLISQLLSSVRHELGSLSIPILIEISQTVNIDSVYGMLTLDTYEDDFVREDPGNVKRQRLSSDVCAKGNEISAASVGQNLNQSSTPHHRRLFSSMSDPCCRSFVDTALRFAERLIDETSGLENSVNFESLQVLDLIAAIELNESLYPDSHSSTSSQILYKGLWKVMVYLQTEETQNSSLFGSQLGKRILQRIVSHYLRSSILQSHIGDVGDCHHFSRDSLLQALSDLAWKHLLIGTSFSDTQEDKNISTLRDENENFDYSVINALSPRHKDLITRYVNSYVQSCNGNCLALAVRLGMTHSTNLIRCTDRSCLCVLNCDYNTISSPRGNRECYLVSEYYLRSLDVFLVEDVISWSQRYADY